MSDIPKNYDFTSEEQKILDFWKKHQIYKFNPKSKKKLFSIDTPPPTVSGKMHLGHSCSYSQQDFIARFKRMQGFEVFYPFGTDDNGLPTEKLVQKEKKVNSALMERNEFIKLCLDFLKEERPKFIQDWIKIGMSCDFDVCYSTIDPHSRRIAQKTFLDFAKKKLVYRKEAPVIWDTHFQTSIAQAELEDVERKSFFNDIIFKTEDDKELIIATTRPELLGACVAIFAHPDDERYKDLFGKHAISPLYNVKVPILADERADPQKGTGIVMCCTFGDQTDIEWYLQYDLPLKVVITPDGKMNEKSGKYEGLKIEEAKKQIIEDLKEAKLLVKQEEITQTVNVGERSKVPVEIINSKQWYVKYLDLKDQFLTASEQLKWFPPFMKHRLDNWIKGLNWDWAVSRQRHFGVPIPVWYDKEGNVYYPDEEQLPVDPLKDKPQSAPKDLELIPETDVFDTWFTSGSSPNLAADYFKDDAVYKKLLPMDLRPQAHDIINFWLFYTMVKSQLLTKQNPWKQVVISGFVLDPKGKKMSKSLGNAIAPQDVMKKYSSDALRYWAASSKLGEDIPFQEKELITCKKLVTKLWNASKFVSMHLQDYDGSKPKKLEPLDEWMLAKTNEVIKAATQSFEQYEYARARHVTDAYFWTVLCDNYLEIVKDRLYNPDQRGEDAQLSAQYTLREVFIDVLKLFAPFIPFITETVYIDFFKTKSDPVSIHVSQWPKENYNTKEKHGQIAVDIISAVRRFKSEQNVSLRTEVELLTIQGDKKTIEPFLADIQGTTKTKNIVFNDATQIEIGDVKINIKLSA